MAEGYTIPQPEKCAKVLKSCQPAPAREVVTGCRGQLPVTGYHNLNFNHFVKISPAKIWPGRDSSFLLRSLTTSGLPKHYPFPSETLPFYYPFTTPFLRKWVVQVRFRYEPRTKQE